MRALRFFLRARAEIKNLLASSEHFLYFRLQQSIWKHLVIGTVWEVQFTDEDFHIDLNQELYEECLERTSGVEERNMTDVDEEELIVVSEQLFWKNPNVSTPFLLKARPN